MIFVCTHTWMGLASLFYLSVAVCLHKVVLISLVHLIIFYHYRMQLVNVLPGWGLCPKLRINWLFFCRKWCGTFNDLFIKHLNSLILWSLVTGCNRLHTGDGFHSLAPQWYREDSVSSVLQMEGSRPWTLQACSGDKLLIYSRFGLVNKYSRVFILLFFFCIKKAKFEFHHGDYEKQFLHALGRKDKAGMVMNNPNQSVFLFLDRQHLQVSSGKLI